MMDIPDNIPPEVMAKINRHMALQYAYIWVMSTRLYGVGFLPVKK